LAQGIGYYEKRAKRSLLEEINQKIQKTEVLSPQELKLAISSALAIVLILMSLLSNSFAFLYRQDKGTLSNKNEWMLAWEDVQKWAHNNTEPTVTFIVPPYISGFRIFSKRGIMVDWKDGGTMVLDSKYEVEWKQRLNALNISIEKKKRLEGSVMKTAYESLDTNQIQDVGRKYQAQFVVVERPKQFDLRRVYGNAYFSVYSLFDK
jgi:hypothetical protein